MSALVSAEHRVRIARPAEVVFDFLGTGANNPRWQARVITTGQDGTVVRPVDTSLARFSRSGSYQLTRGPAADARARRDLGRTSPPQRQIPVGRGRPGPHGG